MFEIKIIQKIEVEKPCEMEWVKLHDDEKRHDAENNPQYGYRRADATKTVIVERQVLSQAVDKLDLVAVIKAVNGIGQ